MSAKHAPGPWRAVRNSAGMVLRRTYRVERTAADGGTEYLLSASGRAIRFRSQEAARAAIDKATGSAA